MPHVLDPQRLDDEAAYLAALDELEELMATDPDTPAGRRFDELAALIEDYEAREDMARQARSRRLRRSPESARRVLGQRQERGVAAGRRRVDRHRALDDEPRQVVAARRRPATITGTICPTPRRARAHAPRALGRRVEQHRVDGGRIERVGERRRARPRAGRARRASSGLRSHSGVLPAARAAARLRDQRLGVVGDARDDAARMEFERVRFAGRARQARRRVGQRGARARRARAAAGRADRRPSGPCPRARGRRTAARRRRRRRCCG